MITAASRFWICTTTAFQGLFTFRIGSALKSFNFHGNKPEGEIPRSLTNCKQLDVLDLRDNHLNDTFLVWLGTLPKLKVLSLRSNKLHGSIRSLPTGNMFPQLRILDLSSNAFTKSYQDSVSTFESHEDSVSTFESHEDS
ncbi:hypothetical protein MTR67_049990 [Solanum verrucosum]|uniref:LRR-RLK n=1 Tax=Solanum verrucosum TaxID=315347 RepID=A0AAF0V173_SOLVR|nr:hypothetical protein MTR67_049990 [Solanum verrucosum]